MARFIDTIDLPCPIETAFDYLADFSNTAEWDPGVVRAESLTRGPNRVGSRFRVEVQFLGRTVPLEYEIAELQRPTRLVLVGGDASLRAVDEISLVRRLGGTRVVYEAKLSLGGRRRFLDPLLNWMLQRIGSAAARGLRHWGAAQSGGEPERGHAAGI